MMKRRTVLQGLLAGWLALHVTAWAASSPVIEVYKSATCGCCSKWVEHLQTHGLTVKAHNVANPSDYREKFGVPQALGACHTATVEGYAIEGHVPAQEIKRLLKERPQAKGLAVPAMPLGSPGMEGKRSDAYDVLLIHKNGSHSVYQHYDAHQERKQP